MKHACGHRPANARTRIDECSCVLPVRTRSIEQRFPFVRCTQKKVSEVTTMMLIGALYLLLSSWIATSSWCLRTGVVCDRWPCRNMLSALTSALVTQIMSNCSVTKENCCMWSPEAKKLLTLLYWMATNRAGDCFVTELLLTWIAPETSNDKSQQMAGALVLFELIQRHRQQIIASPAAPADGREQTSVSLLGSLASEFVRHLIQLIRQGSVVSPTDRSTQRLKLTKSGLVALEALIAVLCDQATGLGSEASQLSSSQDTEAFLEAVDVVIHTLQQYHAASSSRKKLFLLALNQLSQYAKVCRSTRGHHHTSSSAAGALEMLCWHWSASAMLLCTRSDAILRIRKMEPLVALKSEILWWSADGNNNTELLAARLRRLCVLLSFASGSRGNAMLEELSQDLEAKGKLLLVLVRALKASIQQKSRLLAEFVTHILRALSLREGGSGSPDQEVQPKQFLGMEKDCQALLSLLLRTLKSAIVYLGATGGTTGKRSLLHSLEQLVADFGVQSSERVLLSELQRYLGLRDSNSMLVRAECVQFASSVTHLSLWLVCFADCSLLGSSRSRAVSRPRSVSTRDAERVEVGWTESLSV